VYTPVPHHKLPSAFFSPNPSLQEREPGKGTDKYKYQITTSFSLNHPIWKYGLNQTKDAGCAAFGSAGKIIIDLV